MKAREVKIGHWVTLNLGKKAACGIVREVFPAWGVIELPVGRRITVPWATSKLMGDPQPEESSQGQVTNGENGASR